MCQVTGRHRHRRAEGRLSVLPPLQGYKDTFGPAHPSLGGPAPSATTKQPSRYAEWTRTPASLGQRLKRLDTLRCPWHVLQQADCCLIRVR